MQWKPAEYDFSPQTESVSEHAQRDAKELSDPSAPLKDQLFIATPDIDTWSSGLAGAKVPNARKS